MTPYFIGASAGRIDAVFVDGNAPVGEAPAAVPLHKPSKVAAALRARLLFAGREQSVKIGSRPTFGSEFRYAHTDVLHAVVRQPVLEGGGLVVAVNAVTQRLCG
jgi:hypothetical protein